MARLTVTLLLMMSTSLHADDGVISLDPFAGEAIQSYESHEIGGHNYYEGETVEGSSITGHSATYGDTELNTWSRTDSDGNTSTTLCKSFNGHTYCY